MPESEHPVVCPAGCSLSYSVSIYLWEPPQRINNTMRPTKINRTPRSERDKIFQGWNDFMALSTGIMEEEDETDKEDEKENEEDEILLAVPPRSHQVMAAQETKKSTKRKRKPDCLRGNPAHRKSDGKFAHRGKGGSWSKGPHSGTRSDCQHGSKRMPGKRWTKVACGRKKVGGKPDPKGNKADYRCHDGKKVREQKAEQALRKLTHEEGQALIAEVVASVIGNQVIQESVNPQLEAKCNSAGLYSLNWFLNLQDKISQSQDGKLSDKR